MILKVTLKPLDAYFLGTDRSEKRKGGQVQLAQRKPYFIRSNRLPSQSALFGALRYLGIQNPRPSFEYDAENIGPGSYSLLDFGNNQYGKIRRISPLFLTDEDGRHYVPAPRHRVAAEWLDDTDSAPFVPFSEFTRVQTLDGPRCIPAAKAKSDDPLPEYDEKKAFDGAALLCLESGELKRNVFRTQVRVGINRLSQKAARNAQAQVPDQSGFFKKEFVILNEPYRFMFYAEAADDFFCHERGVVYMGQGRAPFAACVQARVSSPAIPLAGALFPGQVHLNGCEAAACEGLMALSDLYYDGSTDDLRSRCDMMIAGRRDLRVFTTVYGHAQDSHSRYQKGPEALRLIDAGSAFLFIGDRAVERKNAFLQYLELRSECQHARVAGFNHLIGSETRFTWPVNPTKQEEEI